MKMKIWAIENRKNFQPAQETDQELDVDEQPAIADVKQKIPGKNPSKVRKREKLASCEVIKSKICVHCNKKFSSRTKAQRHINSP
jgi:hypothetical protein